MIVNITKIDMARIVVQSHYELKDAPSKDDPRVQRAINVPYPRMQRLYKTALLAGDVRTKELRLLVSDPSPGPSWCLRRCEKNMNVWVRRTFEQESAA